MGNLSDRIWNLMMEFGLVTDPSADKTPIDKAYCGGCRQLRDFLAITWRANPEGGATVTGARCLRGHSLRRAMSQDQLSALRADITGMNRVSASIRSARLRSKEPRSNGAPQGARPGRIVETTTRDGKTARVNGQDYPLLTSGDAAPEPGSRVRAVFNGVELELRSDLSR